MSQYRWTIGHENEGGVNTPEYQWSTTHQSTGGLQHIRIQAEYNTLEYSLSIRAICNKRSVNQ